MVTDAEMSNAPASSLPRPVLDALSIPGIDHDRFGAVVEAFGTLPINGQVELANRLIGARGAYVVHRGFLCDSERAQGVRRKRLEEIGIAADRLLRLLHRDEAEPQPWNLHPAITLSLPQLVRIASEHRPNQIWDQGLSRLAAMLTDLAKVGAQAGSIFPGQFPKQHGGARREGHSPATGLVEQLIEVYAAMRTQYPRSGPVLAFDASLKGFVRAGLAFAVSPPPEVTDSDARRYRSLEANLLETDLPETSRITDDAIRAIFDRWRRQIKPKINLI
jgi:hypothetical protein